LQGPSHGGPTPWVPPARDLPGSASFAEPSRKRPPRKRLVRGHVFVGFLALILLHDLDVRHEHRKEKTEWADIRRDLDALQEITVTQEGKSYRFWIPIKKGATEAFRAAGVAIPPAVIGQ